MLCGFCDIRNFEAYIHQIYLENIKTDEDDLEFGNDSIKRINK